MGRLRKQFLSHSTPIQIMKSTPLGRFFGAILILFLLCQGISHARTWTSTDGSKTFEAELTTYHAGTGEVGVTLPNGKRMVFDQKLLSEADIAFVKENGPNLEAPANTQPTSVSSSSGSGTKSVPDELPAPDGKEADTRKPVKVFILLGQSNMLGFGGVDPESKDGTLRHAIKNKGKYPHLVDDSGQWTVRKDVRNVFVLPKGGRKIETNDWLTISKPKIGPEIQIGHIMGELFDEPVLILKSCIGNRSLGWDLLPPGSESYEHGGKTIPGYGQTADGGEKSSGGWYAGKQYDDDTANAKYVLDNLDTFYPGAKDHEVEGFFFWQGDKDRYNVAHAERYELNLVQFIKQLRKDFDAPDAKFVCATLGQTEKGAGGNEGLILDAQLAVDGESGKYPEFEGNVASVYSHPLSQGGSSNAHYGGNAETYMDIGEGMGRAMADLY